MLWGHQGVLRSHYAVTHRGVNVDRVNGILWHDAGTIWQHIATLAVDIVTSGAVFLGAGTLLRVKELAQLLAFMADYVGRRAASAAGDNRL